MASSLSGVLPILQTPLTEEDTIDRVALSREIDWAFATGANGVGTGMVSEILRLTFDERRELTELLVDGVRGRGATFAAVGAESAKQAVQYALIAEKAGCDAVMATPPLLTSMSKESHLDYYRAIAEHVSLHVIVQDASGYVGRPIPLEVHVALLNLFGPEKILFKPEGAPIGPNLTALHQATGGQARVYDGSGGIYLIDCFNRGIVGTMPGMDLLDGIVALWLALKQGRIDEANAIYFPICAIVTLQLQAGLDGFLAIEKHLLHRRKLFPSVRQRQPVGWTLDEATVQEVNRLFDCLQDVLKRHSSVDGA